MTGHITDRACCGGLTVLFHRQESRHCDCGANVMLNARRGSVAHIQLQDVSAQHISPVALRPQAGLPVVTADTHSAAREGGTHADS